MTMQGTSSKNFSLILESFQSLHKFEVDYTKKYAQVILKFF